VTAPGIVDVSGWDVRFHEPGGSDANVWLIDPSSGDDALFKPVVQKAGRRQGEDWAEKAVEQVAELLEVPHARIRMAMRGGHPGLLSYDLAPSGYELQAGAVLIGEVDDRLVPRAKERLGHNLDNIHQVLSGLPAVGMPDGFTAYDQFCGYLMLDALVANRDRHEENWGVLRSPGGQVALAPSFDHGNSLGFNLLDDRRLLELERDPTLSNWCRRGLADRFEGRRKTSLVEFAFEAFGRSTTGAGEVWLGRLDAIPPVAWDGVVARIPAMSAACRTFSVRLLTTNQRRLLDGD
jgi:hypothetical protein